MINIHTNKNIQLVIGFAIGIGFGFALQRGGVTNFDVIVNQLLFKDFTVVKIMLSAMLTGMIGVHLLRQYGFAQLHPKPGSVGSTIVGGLIFGVGLACLATAPARWWPLLRMEGSMRFLAAYWACLRDQVFLPHGIRGSKNLF